MNSTKDPTIKPSPKKKLAEVFDHNLQISVGKTTGGLSPPTLIMAFFDWVLHLSMHPSKQMALFDLMQQGYMHLMRDYFSSVEGKHLHEYARSRPPTDKRFVTAEWQQFPYNFVYESFVLMQEWWHQAATNVRGVNCHHEEIVDFTIRQYLDMLSPSNFFLLNPEVQNKTAAESGQNLVRGFENFLDDLRRRQLNEQPAGAENFVIGKNIAVSKGKVIYRNNLIELIQYSPTTDQVYKEPVLITPAWIMKYYILDLAPKHSLVIYLVNKGHTVFMISWKNPRNKDRDLGMDDYLKLGIFESLEVVNDVIPDTKVHLVGYCLGGTLSAIAAATLARESDERLKSLTLFAARTDFTEPGELGLFIDESQIAYLENLMQEKGYLDTHQMAGAFQLLRSNDLIWSRMIREYLLGERKPLTDLIAWNADATRLPYRMHSEYLRHLFLRNELAEGKYLVFGRPIALTDIKIPIFVVATERDHVSPWGSVFKINLLTTGDVTFVLTSGGHNVGIVSLPSKKTKRYFRSSTLKKKERYMDKDTWFKSTKPTSGSWWPEWESRLAALSSEKTKKPPMGTAKNPPLQDAPGDYVLEK